MLYEHTVRTGSTYSTFIRTVAAAAYGDFHTGEEPLNHVTGSWDPLAGVKVWH